MTTERDRHDHDAQLARLRRDHNDIWGRLLETMSEVERRDAEARADRGAPPPPLATFEESAAMAAELYATGRYDALGAAREADALMAELAELAQAWDAASDRLVRRRQALGIAAAGPAAITRRGTAVELGDGSRWQSAGDQAYQMEFPPAAHNTLELRRRIAERLAARDRGDLAGAGLALPPAPPTPGPETGQAVAEARSEALGLRGLWSFRGSAGELIQVIGHGSTSQQGEATEGDVRREGGERAA